MRNLTPIPFYAVLCLIAWAPLANAAQVFQLPPVEVGQDRLATLPHVFVKEFVLQGNTVFSSAELHDAVLNAYRGRDISAAELQELRHQLSQYYAAHGYVNSGALIPDQDVRDGTITLTIIEGRLSAVEISGNRHLRSDWLAQRIRNHDGEVLNTKVLQERLQLLQQHSLVQRFNAELGPGLHPGEAILNFHLTEKEHPYELSAEFNNHRSPAIGAYRLVLDAKHYSLTGRADELHGRYGVTKGLNDYLLSYSLPLTARETRLNLRLERSDSEVVAEPFAALNVESQADTYAIGLSHPFYRRYSEDFHYKVLEAGVSLEKRKSQTYLLGQPFSFSSGTQDGISEITALRLTQSWLDRSRTRVIAFYSSVGVGLDMWSATINDGLDALGNPTPEPDGEFVTWLGQLRWIERLPALLDGRIKTSQILLRTDFQWASDDLLPLEKFTLGGANSVRGYRENQLTRDNGLLLSLEWQIPVNRQGTLLIAPFIDYGWGDNRHLPNNGSSSLASIGLGLLWNPYAFVQTQVYWGYALRDVPDSEDKDLQDNGLHFSLRVSF
jgi:hemolysin activation/secretion protein